MNVEFNDSFNEEGVKPGFIYKRNPLVDQAWHIMRFDDGQDDYTPIGEYILLDREEEPDITEKKLFNLVGIMNGRKRLIDFKDLTKERILYNIISETPEDSENKVVFRTYNGNGVSKENAVLTIEKGVLHDDD